MTALRWRSGLQLWECWLHLLSLLWPCDCRVLASLHRWGLLCWLVRRQAVVDCENRELFIGCSVEYDERESGSRRMFITVHGGMLAYGFFSADVTPVWYEVHIFWICTKKGLQYISIDLFFLHVSKYIMKYWWWCPERMCWKFKHLVFSKCNSL